MYGIITKCVCRYFACELGNCVFTIGNTSMEYVDTYLHLGHVISNNLDDERDITRAQGKFVGQVNNVLLFQSAGLFCKVSFVSVFLQLFTGVSYGICAIGNCWILVGCRIKASAESGTYLTMLTALCCCCFANVCQCLKHFAVDL